MNKKLLVVFIVFFVCAEIALMGMVEAEDYYSGMGTSNLEVGLHSKIVEREVDGWSQIEFGVLTNTGTVNMTAYINNTISFEAENLTIINPKTIQIDYFGKREYTGELVAYPFFLMPYDIVQTWANITISKTGNYTILMQVWTDIHLPSDVNTPLSTVGGKMTAKIVCIPLKPFLIFGVPAVDFFLLVGSIGGANVGALITVKFVLHRKKTRKLPIGKPQKGIRE